MITENEIIEIMCKELELCEYSRPVIYHDKIAVIAKAIIDKIKEKEIKVHEVKDYYEEDNIFRNS